MLYHNVVIVVLRTEEDPGDLTKQKDEDHIWTQQGRCSRLVSYSFTLRLSHLNKEVQKSEDHINSRGKL